MIFNPIGLGLVGYSLAYHKSWAVLAVAEVFVTFGSLSLIPITVNYICMFQQLCLSSKWVILIINCRRMFYKESR